MSTTELERVFFDEVQLGSVQIFNDVRSKAATDPELESVGGGLHTLRKNVVIGKETRRIVIALVGGQAPEEAELVRIVPVGLKSHLEVTNKGGKTIKTVNHKRISSPATMHDVVLYRQIANLLG